eukprot:478765-Pleurochrysis_carterae.AAC.2
MSARMYFAIFVRCGEDVFSMAELEHCVLRAPMSRPRSFVTKLVLPKATYPCALSVADCRLNFAISCGSASGSQSVPIYTPSQIEEQLDATAKLFLSDSVKVSALAAGPALRACFPISYTMTEKHSVSLRPKLFSSASVDPVRFKRLRVSPSMNLAEILQSRDPCTRSTGIGVALPSFFGGSRPRTPRWVVAALSFTLRPAEEHHPLPTRSWLHPAHRNTLVLYSSLPRAIVCVLPLRPCTKFHRH